VSTRLTVPNSRSRSSRAKIRSRIAKAVVEKKNGSFYLTSKKFSGKDRVFSTSVANVER